MAGEELPAVLSRVFTVSGGNVGVGVPVAFDGCGMIIGVMVLVAVEGDGTNSVCVMTVEGLVSTGTWESELTCPTFAGYTFSIRVRSTNSDLSLLRTQFPSDFLFTIARSYSPVEEL